MPAPRKFTHQQLQAAALELIDQEGLAGLTMRALAARLGTGPMTIYNYVDGREGLEHLVTGAVMAQVRRPDGHPGDWRARVEAIAEAIWRAVRAHPNAIPLVLTTRSLDEEALAPAEALLQALAGSGRSGADLLAAFRVVSGFIAGFAQAELTGPLASASGQDAGAITARMADLPAQRFPRLIEIAHAATGDPQAEFRSGLKIILTGLGASAPHTN
ncbi:TetR/AcrR family transcriptional regulator [Actinomadura viridis]|uniref:AcrR family transcriptional regulator n=1 Tax=Actinomadura viridis TaxID=58110 RepID=A0A931GHU5_9ACTN|nr:TetR/AcrR family transcriptional regulator [Actinomadura viridis]MBG6087287.1 AcrR family transcriptional regulator [Actinomadura viridis]